MADLIDRSALLAAGDATKMNVVFEDWNRLDWKTQQHILNYSRAFKRLVEHAPAVYAVEVVRCKDCRWRESMACPLYLSQLTAHGKRLPLDDDFCSYGERKET